jgi:hypothetical protein
MTHVIAALPVDARPAVRSQVQDMVACAGCTLLMPEVHALGHFRQPANRDALAQWLRQHAAQADALVLSLDMLVYGGLVPSRFCDDTLPQRLQRLQLLQDIKAQAPHKPVFAFAATLRISNNNVADEEKPYWAAYGTLLWAWSFHGDRATVLGDSTSQALADAAQAQIPPAVLDDYRASRRANFEVTREALRLVQRGVINRLVLPQDDTAEWGLNIAERRALQAEVATLGISAQVAIYPGADEVMHTLCARLVAQLQGRPGLRVALSPSDPTRLPGLMALYEDRPLLQSIHSQVQAVGATLVDDSVQADVLLAVHSQGHAQGDWALQRPLPLQVGLAPGWLAGLHRWQRSGRPLLLADLAYANGGDPWLLRQGLPALHAYAGWNTASNSLGSVLAQAVLAQGRWHEAQAPKALALRLLEDLQYQAVLRQKLRESIDESRASPAQRLAAARAAVIAPANAWAAAQGLAYRVADVALPWGRSFEIDLQLAPAA